MDGGEVKPPVQSVPGYDDAGSLGDSMIGAFYAVLDGDCGLFIFGWLSKEQGREVGDAA
jgi:hypothetical protein